MSTLTTKGEYAYGSFSNSTPLGALDTSSAHLLEQAAAWSFVVFSLLTLSANRKDESIMAMTIVTTIANDPVAFASWNDPDAPKAKLTIEDFSLCVYTDRIY